MQLEKGMKWEWGHVPFVRFLIFAVIGVCLSYWISPDLRVYQLLRVGCVVFALLGVGLLAVRGPFYGPVFLVFVMLVCWMRAWDGYPTLKSDHFSQHDLDYLIGYVADEVVQDEQRVRFRLKVTGGGEVGRNMQVLQGNLQVTVNGQHQLSYGDLVVVPAVFNEVPPPRNPGEMNYAAHLAKENCWHQAYYNEEDLRISHADLGQPIIARSLLLRRQMVDKFERFLPQNEDVFSIASTLILGYRVDLSRELLETYSETGTIHVLSVSGMHVVIVFWLLSYLLFWMNWHPILKILRIPLLVLAVWAYAFLTGLSPSVLRAAMMLSFVLWATARNRQSRTYNNIAASAFLLLIYDPKLLLNLGFQLSYLAVIGIVFLNPLIQGLMPRGSRVWRPIQDYSAMSVAAQAGAFPLAMYYFQQFPVYFLLANLLIVLPASGIMYLGFGILLLPEAPITVAALELVGMLLGQLIILMNTMLEWVQTLPAASLNGMALTWWQCLLIYALMLTFTFAWLNRSKVLFFAFAGIAIALCGVESFQHYAKWSRKKLIIHQVRSQLAISYTGDGEAWLYTDLPDREHGSLRYSVWPYLRTFAAVEDVKWFSPAHNKPYSSRLMRHDIIQVGEKRLAIMDGRDGPLTAGWPLAVDVLLIRHNPAQSVEEMHALFNANKLVFDGSNFPSTVNRLVKEAEAVGLEYYIMKDNYAYVWVMD